MAGKICVKTGAVLFYFGLFQALNAAILNNIRDSGSFFAGSVKAASVAFHVHLASYPSARKHVGKKSCTNYRILYGYR